MNNYLDYKKHTQKITDVAMSMSVLHWDQETHMPNKGAKFRAQQLATLSQIMHELSTDNEYASLLEKLNNDSSLIDEEKRNVNLSFLKLQKSKKYTSEFVKKNSLLISDAFQKWKEAKTKNDFTVFQHSLQKLVEHKKEECELLGYNNHPYDALLNEYEPGLKTADVDTLFKEVKVKLIPLVNEILKKERVDDSFNFQKFNTNKQWDFGIELLQQMGYDFEAGRQDLSSHPFSTHFSPNDCRVTTRIDENNLSEMIWSCIHEGGHALYEQGIISENYGLPSGETISLGIHESQSRLWENNVGRSLNYWKKNYPRLKSIFPSQLDGIDLEQFYKSANAVKPSLIRTNADELTYHFHVMIRYEIEKDLIGGQIKVEDLPQIWNNKYEEYLAIEVPSDAEGILQDIHWSHGSFGYFPTYSIGSFYAAQFFHQAKKEIPHLERNIEKGEFGQLLNWLRKNIHQHGKRYNAEDICIRISGEKLNFKYFMLYVNEKYSTIYNI